MMKTFRTFFSFALLLMLIGCGQKGPLYLPENTVDLDQPNQSSQTEATEPQKSNTEDAE